MAPNHREIRRLLRLMRRPNALDREPLAIMLRESLRTNTSREAALKTIASAFDVETANGRLLREIVQRCDIAGDKSTAVAASLGVSVRQFFRYRNDAVEAVAQAVSRNLRQPDDASRKQLIMAAMVAEFDPRAALDLYVKAAPSPTEKTAFETARAAIWAGVDATQYIDGCKGAWRLLALVTQARRLLSVGLRRESEALVDSIRAAMPDPAGGLYDAVAFEIAELERRALRRRGVLDGESELVERMHALAAGDSRLSALSRVAEAEAACSIGELNAAAVAIAEAERYAVEHRDLDVLSRAAYASASLCATKGELEDARALFNAASSTIAAFDAAYALRAAAFAGRCALQLGVDWTPPRSLMDRHAASWTLIELTCVEARKAIGVDATRAVTLAESALKRGMATDADAATLYARATVAAALDKSGNPVEAKRLWLRCWIEGTRMNDHTALFDLLVVPAAVRRDLGPLALDDDLLQAAQRVIDDRYPAFFAQLSSDVTAALISLLRDALAGAIGSAAAPKHLQTVGRAAVSAFLDSKLTRDRVMQLGYMLSRATAESVGWLLPTHARAIFRAAFLVQWDRRFSKVVERLSDR
jgi:hypothetical protein